MDDLYILIEEHAKAHALPNTLLALPLSQKLLGHVPRKTFRTDNVVISTFEHCMQTTKMLMDLHMTLPGDEEDILLAAMLCHTMLKKLDLADNGQALVTEHHLDPRVLEVVRLITRPLPPTHESLTRYYGAIQHNKLAVLVTLCDRSNLVEQLSDLSISEVNEFVDEMRGYFLPMCVCAKQYYPDCIMSMTIMLEKIRCLIDVTDIIASRYQSRAASYNNEILSLIEENARLRGMISQFRAENG